MAYLFYFCYQGPIYSWHTLTGEKLNKTELSTLGQKFFCSVIKAQSRNYTKHKVFRLCLFCEKLRFIYFAQRA